MDHRNHGLSARRCSHETAHRYRLDPQPGADGRRDVDRDRALPAGFVVVRNDDAGSLDFQGPSAASVDLRPPGALSIAELEELGASLEAEVTPQVIELEDQTVTLSGNVEDQYAQWREVLADIYRVEIGSLELPPESIETTGTL